MKAINASPIADDQLMDELQSIESEVKCRKKRGESSAAWAFEQRMAALRRFNERHNLHESTAQKKIICYVEMLHDGGMSYPKIADELAQRGVSR